MRLPRLLAGAEPDISTVVSVHVALAGIALAGGSPALAELDDETLRGHLLEAGRKLLGRPRKRSAS